MAAVAGFHPVNHLRWPPAGLRGVRRRMLCALGASLLLHLWFADHIPSGATRARFAPSVPPLETRIVPTPAPQAPGTGVDPAEPALSDARPYATRAPVPAAERANPVPRDREARPAALAPRADAPDPPAPRLAPATIDPVYYSVRELDVFPAPVTPLRFEYPPQLAATPIAAQVVVSLLVDEVGGVDQVTVMSAEPSGRFEEHTRATLASARFTPGRREGRAVKSRVTVRVNYDPATREGVAR